MIEDGEEARKGGVHPKTSCACVMKTKGHENQILEITILGFILEAIKF